MDVEKDEKENPNTKATKDSNSIKNYDNLLRANIFDDNFNNVLSPASTGLTTKKVFSFKDNKKVREEIPDFKSNLMI